jgi:squalene synthase HpnC
MMRKVADLGSGKGHRDENFPVASFLIHPRHRDVILAFYRFVRAADDVADHATAGADEKLRLLDQQRRTVMGEADASAEGVVLRAMLNARNLTPQHALDLLEAFSRDVTKLRYRDWNDLMDYCRVSAMPVGRFVLDVHDESRLTWPASDALCAALQIVNHLQDCAKDFRNLNRVYIPLDAFAAAGIGPDALNSDRASPALMGLIAGMARKTSDLLVQSRSFAGQVRDHRLALEIKVIQTLAENLSRRLVRRDPLSERVHHSKSEALLLAISASVRFAAGRVARGRNGSQIVDGRR